MKSLRKLYDPTLHTGAGVVLVACCLTLITTSASGQNSRPRASANGTIPASALLRITKAEDERRWDADLRAMLASRHRVVRKRAALAAGRIGNEEAVPSLVNLLKNDPDNEVRSMSAFALGEVESINGADALVEGIKDSRTAATVRSRAIEALGKITAALSKEQEAKQHELAGVILEALRSQMGADRETILLGLTAVLRSRPAGAGPVVATFLKNSDARIRADAANTLARLRLKDGNDQLQLLLKNDPDPIVRANAARVLGATEEKTALGTLLERSIQDTDSRVRVSAIRSVAALKDPAVITALLARGEALTKSDLSTRPAEINEAFEIATALGKLAAASENQAILNWLRKLRKALDNSAPEVEIAYARVWPGAYLSELGEGPIAISGLQRKLMTNWRAGAGIAAGLGEIASAPQSMSRREETTHWAEELLDGMLQYRKSGIVIESLLPLNTEYAIPDVLRAFAAYKPRELPEVLRENLKQSDVVVRATSADLLGELPPAPENVAALVEALPRAFNDRLNDAALSILDSLAKQKTDSANDAIKTALSARDYLVRKRAATLLKQNGAGDFFSRVGTVNSPNTTADYTRALARIGKKVNVVVTTTKGSFTIELLPDEAPLTVDNFLQLAQRRYFNGVTIHRVVPNFVVQDGDPRGDGNGGPGYEIRCEINEVPFERAVVGMALSGKDTGGSQWFVTHSPQPHLDGGYTVFGRVVAGMDVVDQIVRGDLIKSIEIGRKPGKRS